MSEARRAYNLMRAYVNREWDRVKGLDMIDALKELDSPSFENDSASGQDTEPQSMPMPKVGSETENLIAARQILGITENGGYDEIQRAYEDLSRRTQPGLFDEGSVESEHAQILLRRASWAYNYLTKDLTPTEKRFRSLEIE